MIKLVDKILELSKNGVGSIYDNRTTHISNKKDIELYNKPCGEEHYRLLCAISELIENGVVYDIGTYKGLSALALASSKHVDVISYDINYTVEIKRPENVEIRIGNFYNDPMFFRSDFIFVDIDPHDGIQETNILNYLKDFDYKGCVVFDDIHQFDGMKKFWNSIELPKYDLTHIGHWSGTGLVDFSS